MALLRSLGFYLFARTGSSPVKGLGPCTDVLSLQVSSAPLPPTPFRTPSRPPPTSLPLRGPAPGRCLSPWPGASVPPEVASTRTCFLPRSASLRSASHLFLLTRSRQGPFRCSRPSYGTHFTLGPGCLPRPPARSSS